jgi:hypothetical protein
VVDLRTEWVLRPALTCHIRVDVAIQHETRTVTLAAQPGDRVETLVGQGMDVDLERLRFELVADPARKVTFACVSL